MATESKANEVVGQLTQTTVDSYKVLMDGAVALQDRNVRFALEMFNGSIAELHRQAESNRALAHTLADQSLRQIEASQELYLEAVDAYVNLLLAPFDSRRR